MFVCLNLKLRSQTGLQPEMILKPGAELPGNQTEFGNVCKITEAIFGAFKQYYGGMSDNGDSPAESDSNTEDKQQKAEDNNKEGQKIEQAKADNSQPKTEEPAPATEAEEKPAFRVQIFSARTILPEGDKEFKGLKNCVYEKRGDWYRYMYGGFATKEEAQKECTRLQDKFPGCFVVEVKK